MNIRFTGMHVIVAVIGLLFWVLVVLKALRP